MKDKYENKIVCQQYDKQKSDEKFKSLKTDSEYLRNRKLGETEETLRETAKNLETMTQAVETYKRVNDNQLKCILELQNRISSLDEVVKDANAATACYKAETEKYKELGVRAKSEMMKLKMEKDELLTRIKNERAAAKDNITKHDCEEVTLRTKIQTLETEREENDKVIEKQTTQLKSVMNLLTKAKKNLEQNMKRYETDSIKQKQEKEALEDQLMKMEDHLKSYKEQVLVLERKGEEQREIIRRMSQLIKSSEDRTTAAKRLSDIEKENANLKRELTEAVHSLEEKRDYKDRCDRECNRLRKEIERLKKMEKEKDDLQIHNNRLNNQINQLQVQWDKMKSDREQEKAIAEEVMKLKEQKLRLEKCKHLMRQETLSLQEKVKCTEEFRQSNEVLKSEVESLKAFIKGLQSDNRLLEDKSRRYRPCQQCPVLQRKVEDLIERNSNEDILNRKVQELKADNMILEEKLGGMERRKCKLCDELSHKLLRAETELKDATRRLQKEEKRSCLKCDDYGRKLSQAKQDYQELQDKFNAARTNAQNTGSDVHDLKKQIESEKSNIKSLQRKVQNLEKEKFSAESALHDKETELSQVHGELASLGRRITGLQDNNTDLNRRCKARQEGLVKMDSELRRLKTQNRQLESDMVTLRQEKETLVSKLEMERVNKLELQERLSEAGRNTLRDNIPDIPDLSDTNRPTSLAKKFSSLYTDEYTDAIRVIEDAMDEPTSAAVMLKWLKQCNYLCERLAREQREKLTRESIGFMRQYHRLKPEPEVSSRCLVYVKEFQKRIAQDSLVAVVQICQAMVVTEPNLRNDEKILKYVKRCTELCWMMQMTLPPLYLNFNVAADEKLDKNIYNAYTKSGSKIDYLVWPIIYLHKDGPMLGKGIAQGR